MAASDLPASSIVVVDATEFHDARRLDSEAWKRLLELSSKGVVPLSVTEVVMLEAERQFRTEFNRHLKQAETAARGFDALSERAATVARDSIRELRQVDADDELRAIRQRLQEHGAVIIPTAPVSIDDVLQRDLAVRRPFQDSGKGHRDTVAWLSVIEYVRATVIEEIILVTGNSRDFCAPRPEGAARTGAPQPHPHLVEDLDALPHDVALTVYASIKDFLASEHPTRLEAALKALRGVAEPREIELPTLREAVASAVEAWVEHQLPGQEIDDLDELRYAWDAAADVPREATGLVIMSVEVDDTSLEISKYDEYEGGQALLRVEVSAELELEGFMLKADWYGLSDEIPVSLLDADWNDHMVEIGVSAESRIAFDVLADEQQAEIIELSLAELAPV